VFIHEYANVFRVELQFLLDIQVFRLCWEQETRSEKSQVFAIEF
jgi:hypothetical protein